MEETKQRIERAYAILKAWRKESYVVGADAFTRIGAIVAQSGRTVLVLYDPHVDKSIIEEILQSIHSASEHMYVIPVPVDSHYAVREHIYRIESYILHHEVDSIVAVGSGGTIDIAKGAALMAAVGASLSNDIDQYFGVGKVSSALLQAQKNMVPIIAAQAAALSGTHISKYVNVLDPATGKKKLIVDEAVVPDYSVFDYRSLLHVPFETIVDGALDAIAHTVEVYFNIGTKINRILDDLVELVISLVFVNLPKLVIDKTDIVALEAIAAAADLGGYAIMLGGTSGAHLTSFSLADILPHGIASFLMNPYYIMSYRNKITPQLVTLEHILYSLGFITSLEQQTQKRAFAVCKAFQGLLITLNLPTRLKDIQNFSEKHVENIRQSFHDPQLAMKIENMPIHIPESLIDWYVEHVHTAAIEGRLDKVDAVFEEY